MKRAQIKEGSFFAAKISNRGVVVRVDRISERWDTWKQRMVTQYTVTNLHTQRVVTFQSAGRFRYEMEVVEGGGFRRKAPVTV